MISHDMPFYCYSVSRSSVTDAVLTEQEALQDDTAVMEDEDTFEGVITMLHSSHENGECTFFFIINKMRACVYLPYPE